MPHDNYFQSNISLRPYAVKVIWIVGPMTSRSLFYRDVISHIRLTDLIESSVLERFVLYNEGKSRVV